MAIFFERVLGGTIFMIFLEQVQQYLFSEKRLVQFSTLKPIEIYKTETELEIDKAKIKLQEIKSNLENLVQRRIERALNTLSLSKKQGTFNYIFDVIIKAQAANRKMCPISLIFILATSDTRSKKIIII